MSFYCGHCGSQNHLTNDCSKKHLTFIPPKEEEPERAVKPEKEKEPIFELKLRWPGAPKICTFANLPAFETQKEMDKFHGQFHTTIRHKWKCDACNCWHYITEFKSEIPANCRYFKRAASIQTSRMDFLPMQKEEPKKRVELPRKPKVKSKERELI